MSKSVLGIKVPEIAISIGGMLIVGILGAIVGSFFLPHPWAFYFGVPPIEATVGFALGIAGCAIGVSILMYLGPRKKEDSEVTVSLRARLAKLEADVQQLKIEPELKPEDNAALLDLLIDKIKSESTQSLLDELRSQISDQETRQFKARVQRTPFFRTRTRLEEAIEILQKRANLNLLAGMVVTAAGLAIMWQTIKSAPSDGAALPFALHYIPRITIFFFVELLAYFFLRLYKANLEGTRYYHNELTSIDAKRIAAQELPYLTDDSLRGRLLEALLSTERNFILDKGQTTVEIEAAKASQQASSSLAKEISSVLGKLIEQGAKARKEADRG